MIRSLFFTFLASLGISAQEATPTKPATVTPPPAATPATGNDNETAAAAAAAARPGGTLSIMPTRVVLEGRTRNEEVMLRNSGKAPCTYRIQFVEMDMDENGLLSERPKKEGEVTASDLIRFSPRQVELAPGEAQSVRLQIRKPEGLADGEYRSHLLFQNVPTAEPPAPIGADKAVAVKVTTIMGISIPVILRHGETQGKVSISEIHLEEPKKAGGPPILSFRMTREGNRSLYGSVSAVVESGGQVKKGTVLWGLPAVMIYANTPWRSVRIPMFEGIAGDIKGAKVKIIFTPMDYKGAPIVSYLDIPA
jgi:P pilus assembly chaperone PapD